MDDRKKGLLRWVVLILVSGVIGTNYYAYDALSSIKSILTSELGIGSAEYGWIVGFYSVPNTFLAMAVIGGIALDRFGIRKTGFWFTLSCALGVFLTAYGVSDVYRSGGPLYGIMGSFLPRFSPELKMMVLGRFLFGLGAETSIVVINKIVARWFKGRELATAFALNLAIARCGTALALFASPLLAKSSGGWTVAVWAASVLMTIGLVLFVVYALVDRAATGVETGTGSLLDDDERFRPRDITRLLSNGPFLAVTGLCVTFYGAVFPFIAFCPDILLNKFGVSIEASGNITSWIIYATIVFTPIFGFIVDKRGKRASMMTAGSLLLVIGHLTLGLTTLTPYLSLVLLGVAISLVPAAMWPAVALIVDEKRLGTAYGLMTSIQNLGLFGVPILAGYITDMVNEGVPQGATLDYRLTMVMFACLGVVGFLFSLLLRAASRSGRGALLEEPSHD